MMNYDRKKKRAHENCLFIQSGFIISPASHVYFLKALHQESVMLKCSITAMTTKYIYHVNM